MMMLNGGEVDVTQPGTAANANADVLTADRANAWKRGNWENTFLLLRIDSLMVSRRCAGSSVLVARLHRIAPTRLPPASASSSVRRLTGTIAISGVSGSASCSRR